MSLLRNTVQTATATEYIRRCDTVQNIHKVIGDPCPRRYHKQITASYPITKADNLAKLVLDVRPSNIIPVLWALVFFPILLSLLLFFFPTNINDFPLHLH